jgi:hypothetical protein
MNPVRKSQETPQKKHYSTFSKLCGDHPFKENVPGGRVEYQVRHKKGGKIAFFNFDLAKQLGLIPPNHPQELNDELENKILETFSLVIINEYDINHQVKFPTEEILPKKFMATRYLQLQHPDKTGRTSGDGRSIWNGTVRHNGVTWDVSSCGTGATKLSPACNINKKFYQTGDPSISYGCGLSEISEGLETLFFSEVLGRNGVKTERILAIIEFEKGLAINVRAYPNLLRPSHFFCHLKQGNYTTLKQVADYYIDRQIENGQWEQKHFKNNREKYYYLASQVVKSFAEISAKFEDEYIFCWLDWDGDNILMDGGIIDYGSIRQFGLFHAEYRFDDVQRFSTTILEQKFKARYIAQCFIQIADFLSNGKKRALQNFKSHLMLKNFDHHFNICKNRNLLQKIGFRNNHVEHLISHHSQQVARFRKVFSYFERAKSNRPVYKVADGINRDAIFCMRDLLREIPQMYLARNQWLSNEEFLEITKSSYAKKTDLKLTPFRAKKISEFQKYYSDLINQISKDLSVPREQLLLDLTMRSSIINKYDRVTGDSITHVVDRVQKSKPKLGPLDLFGLMTQFTTYQNLNPDWSPSKESASIRPKKIMRSLHNIVRECREGL